MVRPENCKKVGATSMQEVMSLPAVGGPFDGCELLTEVEKIGVEAKILYKREAIESE